MQLPEKINEITTEVPATFTSVVKEKKFNADFFTHCIDDALTHDLKKFFDKGFNYYKTSGNDSINCLKNFFYLFNDYYKTIMRENNVDIEKQELAIEYLDLILKNIENNFSMFDSLLNTLKLNKKTFDANKFFMIIIGYAINNLKKNHNS
ncbi:hypothetical protein EB118_03245 [bacterium]|nr:hypothetical protein [bacterium]